MKSKHTHMYIREWLTYILKLQTGKSVKKMQVNSCTTSTQKHQNIKNVTKMSCTQMEKISFP